MNAVLKAALDYAKLGLNVFPCHTYSNGRCSCGDAVCRAPGKHPKTIAGFREACCTDSIIRTWFSGASANLAIATGRGSQIVVIDIDADKGGNAAFDAFVNGRDLPPTPTVRTGGGGRHIFFRYPECVIPTGVNRAGIGVDVRSDGGYVVAPPSVHKSGESYTWEIPPEEHDFAQMPAWMIERLKAHYKDTVSVKALVVLQPILSRCAWSQHCIDDAATLSEQEWFAFMKLLSYTHNGEEAAHRYSAPHPKYSYAETAAKYKSAGNTPPHHCKTIAEMTSNKFCENCTFRELVTSPISLGDTATKTAPAPIATYQVIVLKAMLACPTTTARMLQELNAGYFQNPYADVFSSIGRVFGAGRAVSVDSIAADLQMHGQTIAAAWVFANKPQTNPTVDFYARSIMDHANRAVLQDVLAAAVLRCTDPKVDPDVIVAEVMAGVYQRRHNVNKPVVFADVIKAETQRIIEGDETPTLMVGIPEVDEITGGIERGHVAMICARPGAGKSAYLMQQVMQAATDWGTAYWVSLEMDASDLARRQLASKLTFSYQDLRKAQRRAEDGSWRFLLQEELDQIMDAATKLRQVASRVLIDTGSSDITKLTQRIHEQVLARDIGFVAIDYGQLLQAGGKNNSNRAEATAAIARSIKSDIAARHNIPVLVAAQVNRQAVGSTGAKAPPVEELKAHHIAWSDEWTATASQLLMLNRHTLEPKMVTLAVEKNRNGTTGEVVMRLNSQFVFEVV